MNKRKKQWKQECQKAIDEYEKKSNYEYDYYGKIERYKNVKFKKEINYSKIIRYVAGVCIIIYTVLRYLGYV